MGERWMGETGTEDGDGRRGRETGKGIERRRREEEEGEEKKQGEREQ